MAWTKNILFRVDNSAVVPERSSVPEHVTTVIITHAQGFGSPLTVGENTCLVHTVLRHLHPGVYSDVRAEGIGIFIFCNLPAIPTRQSEKAIKERQFRNAKQSVITKL